MIPQTEKRKVRNSAKVNMLFSFIFHTLIVLSLTYFAARQGLLGKEIRKIAVDMVKEKKPEKPKEQVKPKETPKIAEAPKIAESRTPDIKQSVQAPPPSQDMAAPVAAPSAVEVPDFAFEGGKMVESTSDPVQVYRGLIETSIRSHWDRPDMDDHSFVALVQVSVDPSGRISNPLWKSRSGNKDWDDSVSRALASVKSLDHAPPKNFPATVEIRFDVVEAETIARE